MSAPLLNLLTAIEAAAALGVSPVTLSHWRAKHKGPVYLKIGGAIRYRPENIEQYKTGCEIAPVEKPVEKVKREVVRPLRSGRRRVLGSHRLGGHRTKPKEGCGDGEPGSVARPGRQMEPVSGKGATIQ